MTHVDPFAPADSPQHPVNFVPDGEPRSQTLRHEAMPPLLAIDDEPVWSDDPNAAITGQARWEEYHRLLQEHGSDEEKSLLNQAMMENKLEDYAYSVTEPSLASLRAYAEVVRREEEPQVPDPTGPAVNLDDLDSDPVAEDDDLAQKLKALEEEGL